MRVWRPLYRKPLHAHDEEKSIIYAITNILIYGYFLPSLSIVMSVDVGVQSGKDLINV